MLTSERREKKQGKIRNSEYYGMESIFDTLYAESRNGKTFNHLMAIIESEENIKLAYRTIKRNHGSKTPGVDKKTIRNLAKLNEDEYVRLVKKKFSNYHPRPVRREEIPKDNGKTRPLGIPAISDRIVQQCILQVMEPICEAKFSENSNGFRPNRSAETAIAQCCRLIQVQHLYHVVDLDIKGFFDNINHTKLIRQIWSLGIRDKKLLCIIKQMLKAPVILPNGEKIYPTKGTPQGGILSPLLANIVLNELDWWIASQWENMPTRTEFTIRQNRAGAEIKSHVYRALRRSNLKEMHSVRYADDFKIFCSSHTDAVKAYHATAKWLKDRLGLDISPEKSRIVNLKRQYAEVELLQGKLKDQYKRFTAQYGLINSTANKRAFRQDSSYCLLASLEILDEDKNLKRLADIFTKRTIRKPEPVTSVDTPSEALALSIGEKAKVDVPFMAELCGKTEQEVTEELAGVIFRNPVTQAWVTADEYLSGNVREKLAMAETFAANHLEYQVNVEYLKRVQPKNLNASEIEVRLGANWIKAEYITDFMEQVFKTPSYYIGSSIKATYSEISGAWNISGKSLDRSNPRVTNTYGTMRVNGYRLLEDALNLRDTKIYDTVYEDGKERRVLNKKETMLAQQAQEAIRDAFKQWIFKDLDRREELCKVYNERFNAIRPREYDGSHIKFVGMTPEISLMPHQKNAVAHILYGNNTLLAHCVGAGKTF